MSERICVVGAGQMGAGIAQVAAVAGYDVTLVDVSRDQLDRARSGIERSLARLVEKGSVEAGDADAAVARITPANEPVGADCGDHVEVAGELGLPGHVAGRAVGEECRDAQRLSHPRSEHRILRFDRDPLHDGITGPRRRSPLSDPATEDLVILGVRGQHAASPVGDGPGGFQ